MPPLTLEPVGAQTPTDIGGVDYELVTRSELPSWHTHIPFVETGYRRCRTFSSCVCSVVKLHNESANIWLHLPASFLLVPYLIYLLNHSAIASDSGWDFDLAVVYMSVLFGNVSTLLLSGLCHTFYCLSQRAHNFCWFLDFIGLLTGILGGGIGLGHFSFKCCPALHAVYFSAMAVMYPLSLGGAWRGYRLHLTKQPLNPNNGFPEFLLPLTVFNLFSWISVLVVDKAFLPEYSSDPKLMHAWNLAALCPMLLMAGSVFQACNIPERFVPQGMCDIWGHSHQLWHVCGMVLMWVWVHAITVHYEARKEYRCGA